VGASAGGLEAFTELLKQLPLDTGFGFVLVQHLDPLHDSALTQLLARTTALPVCEATNNQRVLPNRVYIIPPNASMGIARGRLQLQPRTRNGQAARSIDFFFEALARDQQERAVGVILSGNASDGTVGLEAIKAEGGLTFAQDASARYDSMPRSAVAAGCVDAVLAPAQIARELARIARHPYVVAHRPPVDRSRPRGAPLAAAATAERPEIEGYKKILLLLRNHTGVDFSLYKTATIHRRMTRRAVLNHRESLESYGEFLRGNAKELDALYADCLIGVTSFFRNADAFGVVKTKVLAKLLAQRTDDPVRIWVLGCSTGQEAYSLAMLFTEAADKSRRPRSLQIFATDLSEANLDKARHGLYPKSVTLDVSPERLRRFFVPQDGGYQVIKSLREQVVFARHNLISDPPFSRMDLISCRNLLIYLEPGLQQKALPAFHYALKPGGYLFLGASESVSGFTDQFAPVDKKHKIYTRKPAPSQAFQLPVRTELAQGGDPVRGPALAGRAAAGLAQAFRGELNAEREADRVTVNQFAPPGVLINDDLQILQFRGSTGRYLEPPTGKARFDLLKMARDGLMLPLRTVINRARKGREIARKAGVVFLLDGRRCVADLEVVPLRNLAERRFLVLFKEAAGTDVGGPAAVPREPPLTRREESSRNASLEQELAETRDFLQSVQEHYEAANEELHASHEEGQSANEELQSLNEELETSKEELESTNEELITVNEEMANRNNELNRLNGDLTNFQTSTKLVILLLGRDLTIRRFSLQAEEQFQLRANDVGRPVTDLRHNLDLPDLPALIHGVITTGCEQEREVRDGAGHWYSLRVRPYLTVEGRVDGAVLVLVDISERKQAEHGIVAARDFAEAVIGTVRDPLLVLDDRFRVQKANEAFLTTFNLTTADVDGRTFFEIDAGRWNLPRLRRRLQHILPRGAAFDEFEVTSLLGASGERTFLLNARPLSQAPGRREKILLGFQDVTASRKAEEALRVVEIKLAQHAMKLEGLVVERTAQLTATNRRLTASVASITRGKEEYRTLLGESQAMQKKLRHLTHQILTAQEEERKKISRELHDEVVQTLVGINVELSSLVHGNAVGVRQMRDKIARTKRLVESSVDAVHRFARELRPAVLDDLGLIPALQAFCEGLAARKKLKIRFTAYRGVEQLASDKRTVLFRVAQEALTNVARHARATRVTLAISKVPGAVRLEIVDNGQSFPVRRILKARSKRLGLVGMRERVEMVGGIFDIESKAGRGTTVRADIPFTSKETKP
jgi:two-component system CheB/CheR fusion protein